MKARRERDAGAPSDRQAMGRTGWLMWGVWLLFLAFPLAAAWSSGQSVPLRWLAVLAIIAFAVLYGVGVRFIGAEPARATPWLVLAGLLMLCGLTWPAIGVGVLSFGAFLVAYSAFALPRPSVWFVMAAILLAAAALPWARGELSDWLGFVPMLVSIAVGTGVGRVLSDGGEAQARLREEARLSGERERVARDVHDILGHSLTVVTVKAELAERLVEVDPERARAELADIQSLTRQALSEIRATVGGLRAAVLADEIENAREILRGAGVNAHLDLDPEIVEHRLRPIVAWVLREAVTNVVRHAKATQCTVTLQSHGIVVDDNGVGLRGHREGNGLRGLRERVESSGGVLTLSDAQPGVRLEVVW